MTSLNQTLVRLRKNYNNLVELNLDEVSNKFAIYKEVGELCFRIRAINRQLAKLYETLKDSEVPVSGVPYKVSQKDIKNG